MVEMYPRQIKCLDLSYITSNHLRVQYMQPFRLCACFDGCRGSKICCLLYIYEYVLVYVQTFRRSRHYIHNLINMGQIAGSDLGESNFRPARSCRRKFIAQGAQEIPVMIGLFIFFSFELFVLADLPKQCALDNSVFVIIRAMVLQ